MTTTALTFNNINFNPVVQDKQIWLTSKELSEALGYKNATSLNKLYNANKSEFTSSMTMTTETVVNGINGSKRGMTVRVFSLRGCHLLAMFARTNIAKEFRHWVLDVLDNEVGAPTVEHEELPSSVKDRNGLIKTVRMAMKRLELGYSEAFNLVLHRFNVTHVGDLTQSQVGEAVEYLHRLMFAGSTDKFRQSDYEPDALSETDDTNVVIEHGTPTTMVNQTMASGKFVGTIDHNGRMAMRELDAEEVIITVDMLPHLIDNRKININVLSRIVLSASHQLYTATYAQRPQQAVAIAQGGYHDSI